MRQRQTGRTGAAIVLHLSAAALGAAVGYFVTLNLIEPANGVILGAAAALLGAMSYVVKELNDAFTKQVERIEKIDLRRQASLATYISAQRVRVNIGWLTATVAAALCLSASSSTLVPQARQAIPPAVRDVLIVVGYAAFFAALPAFLRLVSYHRQIDRFRFEITELVEQQRLRTETLGRMKRPSEFSTLVNSDGGV